MIERPSQATDEVLEYLNNLRESGTVNMLGAGPYLRSEFGMTREESHQVLAYWMESQT